MRSVMIHKLFSTPLFLFTTAAIGHILCSTPAMCQGDSGFFLKSDESGEVEPHYFAVESENQVPLKLQAGSTSVQDSGQMVTVNGQIRIHHQIGFVDLSQRPDELKSFRTTSKWTAEGRVEGSDNLWQVKADESSVLEIFVNLDNPHLDQQVPLYLAPGFEGHISLGKGETALVFGNAYVGPKDLIITWDSVRATVTGPKTTVTFVIVSIALVALAAFVVIRKRKPRSSED